MAQAENKKGLKKTVNLLPMLFRTGKNSKFLSGTIDQLIQTPALKRIDGWVGSKITPTYNPLTDLYIDSNIKSKQDYQLEPSLVVTDEILKIIKSTSYDDLLNQLEFEGANVINHDRIICPKIHSYNPHIDWDKFVNFEKYYWLPTGPAPITVAGEQKEIVSTYNVYDSDDGIFFIFNPDGLTPLPQITLYRGVTYKFNIKSSHTFWIKSARYAGTEGAFRGAQNNGVKEGTITLTIDDRTPKTLYFVSEDNVLNGGEFVIKTLDENSVVDVEKEILGKKNYQTYSGINFTNGLIVKFAGVVYPEKYSKGTYVVEGVGNSIKLIDTSLLETPEQFAEVYDERFDNSVFDSYAFDQSNNLAVTPEYITINKSSQDLNPWTRYNRWFHEDVIKISCEANNVPIVLPYEQKAKRPIIEFNSDIKLYNFGSWAKKNVQFIDTTTKDVFSTVEGSLGFYVNGEELGQGDRVIFLADEDNYVNGKIYEVNFVPIEGKFRISLEEIEQPENGDCVVVTKGTTFKGSNWWYNGTAWTFGQQKLEINQAPLFDVFDSNGVSYSDQTVYKGDFSGTKIFGYGIGTGTVDPILGFSLKYKDISNQAFYLFENYYATDSFVVVNGSDNATIEISTGYLKDTSVKGVETYFNIWSPVEEYNIPIIQYNVIEEEITDVEITAVKDPGYQAMTIDVFLNNVKKTLDIDYSLYASGRNYFVSFKNPLQAKDRLYLKINTTAPISSTGFYETSIGYANNPLNESIGEFTLSELSDHVKTMIDRHPEFAGYFPGTSNIRDIAGLTQYGTRIISNQNPVSFASYFIANDEHNLINAIKTSALHYNQFKLALIDQITSLKGNYTPVQALDIALHNINANKEVSFPYAMSDMVAYGTDAVTRNFTVTDSRNKIYSLVDIFNLTSLSLRSVLIYHTDLEGVTTQLLHERDYEFDLYDSSVNIKIELKKGDVITVDDYSSTAGCYVPPTPTKLGLYPKFEPTIYIDDTYVAPQKVIQGHDGSITLAFNDYRDEIILEYEKRVFNNLKCRFDKDKFDLTKVIPGAFRSTGYSIKEINDILLKDFSKWDNFYGLNFTSNSTTTEDPKTWNYSSGISSITGRSLPGHWRGIYKHFFDTDRPHSHPWEMLGFTIKPVWWDDQYGEAPYTNGNKLLWSDLEKGIIRNPGGTVINGLYARPGLSKIIPVDDSGNLLMPAFANIATNVNYLKTTDEWKFGDNAPVESAWRKSVLWPFAVQILAALTKPADYSSLMFDPSRIEKNIAGQYVYTHTGKFVSLKDLVLFYETPDTLASGYSVFLIEIGRQQNRNYIAELRNQLNYIFFRLAHKAGGFLSKDKLKITIDSINPSNSNPGVSISNEDYEIFLDKSSPVKSIGISGVIVEKTLKGYSIKGYDSKTPFFTCLMPAYTTVDSAIVIGGKSESFVDWTPSASNPMSGFDTTSVSTNSGYKFYKKGQLVRYNSFYYRVLVGHNSGSSFNEENFQRLPSLPTVGGITVQIPSKYESVETYIPYGIEYETIQDVYSVLLGYGRWLESQGVVFDEYNKDLGEILNWTYSAKELVFWATQKWSDGLPKIPDWEENKDYSANELVKYSGKIYRVLRNINSGETFDAIRYKQEYIQSVGASVITLSPFANKLKFTTDIGMVDNLFNPIYEYSLLKADGKLLPKNNVSVFRDESEFTLSTENTRDGIYFARLSVVQREHTLIFNNKTLFNDIIYDVQTGYRQRRVKLSGFITDNWNGDVFSPGFVYDEAKISTWTQFADYSAGDVVYFSGNYYAAVNSINGKSEFDYTDWRVLGSKPVAELIPNFDYKITQFEDFYSLDIDNFDNSQQLLAQHLIGYSPRIYLDNLIPNHISQYKFYQGFIREKGTKNAINKLAKASAISQKSRIDYYENWAIRLGEYGSFSTDRTLEFKLDESEILENPQILQLVDTVPIVKNKFVSYRTPNVIDIKPEDYTNNIFVTTSTYNVNNVSMLPFAGYPRLDDVSATAYNTNSLLDIANSQGIPEGSTIWLGFKENGDWDVLRYTKLPVKVSNAVVDLPGSTLLIETDLHHNINPGDIISISQFDGLVNGVYQVDSVPTLDSFTIFSTVTELNESFYPGTGLIFKFTSSRFKNFDALSYLDSIGNISIGEKVWIDEPSWKVYEKTENFSSSYMNPPTTDFQLTSNQQYGYKVAGNDEGTHFVVAAPKFYSQVTDDYGKLYTYRKNSTGTDSVVFTGSIGPNVSITESYYTGTNVPMFGESLQVDGDTSMIFAGAPLASYVKSLGQTNRLSEVSLVGTPSAYANQGLVKLTKINFDTAAYVDEWVLASPNPEANAKFGSELFVGNISPTEKILFVSSPGQGNGLGAVHFSRIDISTTTINVYTNTNVSLSTSGLSAGHAFGSSISGNKDGSIVVVGAPGNTGTVVVYHSSNYTTYTKSQTIKVDDLYVKNIVQEGDQFASKVLMDGTGEFLFVSAPKAQNLSSIGKVLIFKLVDADNPTYELSQVITNPYPNNGYEFGSNLKISPDRNTLVISSIGASHKPYATFDVHTKLTEEEYVLDETSERRPSSTTFDSGTVKFYSTIKNSGAVFTFVKGEEKFVFAEELFDTNIQNNQLYGNSVYVTNNAIMVGAPGRDVDTTQNCSYYVFDSLTSSLNSWKLVREYENLVDLSKIRSVKTIDTVEQSVIDYLEIIDPIKGKISGLADQELTFKSLFDPAVYTIGIDGTVADVNANWLDEHVGELWWDLSSVKYLWYEQGELEYRRNHWNYLFPGSTIDVYEWIKTPYLPTEWAALADTNEGLALGISGQPKFPDNTVMSVKQTWNPISNSFSNVYYYWVKNKVTVPETKNRRISAYETATLIANPKDQGVKFASIIASDAVMLTNMQGSVIADKINLSIDFDVIDNSINKHTEWLLLQEGNPTDRPTTSLIEKMIDSLLGTDNLGNEVPDPSLTSRIKYGIGVRPAQTMFVDKSSALRTFVEYSNNILVKNNIVDLTNLEKFNRKDEIPNSIYGEYDAIVEDLVERDFSIVTRNLRRAALTCQIVNGRIVNVFILDKGFGYGRLHTVAETYNIDSENWIGPTVTITGNGKDAKLTTEVNAVGEVVKVNIVNPGFGYTEVPKLDVRRYSVIVSVDETVNNRWSNYVWDYSNKLWVKKYTQSYNTPEFWKYIDWVDETYNDAQDVIVTVDEPYQLNVLTNIPEGNYVKVRNAGDGRFIILRKVVGSSPGTYNLDYDLVYQENGTIKILDSIWDRSSSVFGWDQSAGWDLTLFDQTPTTEIENIIRGILEDLFIDQLKVYFNLIFFKMVKHAISEQKFIDWAFKTSFIDVVNYAGELDQRSTYKLNNESYYSSYINEAKPYHTVVRNFTVNYTSTDVTSAIITDFDLPSVYDKTLKQFKPITFGSSELNTYPWKSWVNNYSYSVDSIEIFDGGSGYEIPPVIEIVAQPGDTGTGAKAEAYIALGKVTQIIVTDPGTGYTVTPIVNVIGGGSTRLTTAKVGVRLSNNKVRSNKMTIKFDRVSGYNEVTTLDAHDSYVATTKQTEFVLTWAPNPDKNNITVRVNGIRILSGDYSVNTYTEKFNGYTKKYGSIILNNPPGNKSTVTIEYKKDSSLYHAVDRIRDFYNPTDGMPGNTATMLMLGLEYPGVTVDTLPFRESAGWDSTPFGDSDWDDYIPPSGYYKVISTGTTSTYTLPYVPADEERVNVYLNGIRIDDPYYNDYDGVTIQPNGRKIAPTGTTMETFVGDGYVNTVNIGTTASGIIEFRLETSDGSSPVVDLDLDTYVSGGSIIDGVLSRSDDLEDINIDGDQFVSTTNSYGPEENLPGRVSDSLGINVYTYPNAGAAMVVTKKYLKDSYSTRFPIGMTPPSVESVEVNLNGDIKEYGVDYTIDFDTNEVVWLEDPLSSIQGPYFNPELATPQGPIGINLASTAGDDTYTGPYELGFEWNMFGDKFTQVYVGTNGYLTFGSGNSNWTPLYIGRLNQPAIYIEYCDLWQDYGVNASTGARNIPLITGETPGLYLSNGTVGAFTYWRLRFQGSHYNVRTSSSTVPAYQYEVTLYSDGTNQYVEMIYENTWRGANFNGDLGFVTGIANGSSTDVNFQKVEVDDSEIQNNTSHVFYSTSNGGDWKYAGEGRFDAFKNQNPPPELLSIVTTNVGGTNLLEKSSLTVSAVTGRNNFQYAVNPSHVNSSYVTVNGIKRTNYTIVGTNGTKGRAVLRFATDLSYGDILQVWLFAAQDKAYSEVLEELFVAQSGDIEFDLTNPPGTVEPAHSQVIVEKDGVRLLPPDTIYYVASNGQKIFSLEQHKDYPQGLPDRATVEVYVNGQKREFNRSLKLLQNQNAIQFSQTAIDDGDVIAITLLINHDYAVYSGKLNLTNAVASTSTIKVTTFTNHDGSQFRKERFSGNTPGVFKLSRKVLSRDYIWVDFNGEPLVRDIDFRIESDGKTIKLSDNISSNVNDNIVITTVTDQLTDTLIGYRIFHDNLGRTHYKRLSAANSTQLAADFTTSDTEITVEDASVLTPPNVENNRPGIILIDGERIEFYRIEGNKLYAIRRGTLGTGVKSVHKEGSLVIDQGLGQSIHVPEYKVVDKFSVNSTTNIWTLTNITLENSADFNNIDVLYRGRKLRKPGQSYIETDLSIAYDSSEVNSLGTSSNVTLDPEFTINTLTNSIILGFEPSINSDLTIVKSTLHDVGLSYVSLHNRDTEQVKFLLDQPSFLPDKYYYGQNTDTEQYIVLEDGDTLDSESGDPLIGQ